MKFKIVCCISIIILITSCSFLQELEKSFDTSSQNSTTNTNRSSKTRSFDSWRYTKAELDRMHVKGSVQSWAFQKLLIQAVEKRNIADIKKYISSGANPSRGKDQHDKTSAINKAIQLNCMPCLDAMKPKMNVNYSYHGHQHLPLVQACNTSLSLCKKMVLDYGAHPNTIAQCDWPSVHQCNVLRGVVDQHIEGVIPFLLSQGAQPSDGYSQAWFRCMFYCEYHRKTDVEAFLKSGAAPNFVMKGAIQTALGKAIESKRYDLAELLLQYNADPNLYNKNSNAFQTATYYAIKNNHYEMVKLLTEKGAKINEVVYANGRPAQTGLNFALSRKNTDQRIIDYLISKGGR